MRYFAEKLILFYLRILAKIQLFKIRPIVIGIAGSAGKTSLNYLLSEILSTKYKVKASKGKNSETGIPFDLLDIELKNGGIIGWLTVLIEAKLAILTNWKKYDVYLVEMGIDGPNEPKNMSYLLKIINPDIGLVTNISFEHSLYFDPLVKNLPENKRAEKILELTAQQENFILTTLNKNNCAILNLDDSEIVKVEDKIKAKKITISTKDKNADFYCYKFELLKNSTLMEFEYKNNKYKLEIPNLLPRHFAYEFLFSLAICSLLDIKLEDCLNIIKKHILLAPGRATVFKGIKNTTLIDSSYNCATLEPLIDMLNFLSDIAGKKRRVAILGDMRELGSLTKVMHEKAAEYILKNSDLAILIGPNMQEFTAPILKKHKFNFISFETFTAAKQFILGSIKENDVILVKSSQNTLFLERCVEMLLADKSDETKLCRRGEFWDKIREKSF